MLTSRRFLHTALFTLAAIPLSLAANPNTESVLYAFGGVTGSAPVGGLVVGPSGALFGTTLTGGTLNGGVAFELTPPTSGNGPWTETVLYNFDPASTTIGFAPNAGFAKGAAGVLYGTTTNAGTCVGGGCGSVFSLTPPSVQGASWTATDLHTFTGQVTFTDKNGAFPYGSVIIGGNGELYGTTQSGGVCCGTVYKLTPPMAPGDPWIERDIYYFSGFDTDGVGPTSSLAVGSNGVLYGTTVGGGQDALFNGCGIVFQLTHPGVTGQAWTESIIHTFQDFPTDGHSPYGGLAVSASGSLFGATYYGGDLTACGAGVGCGAVYEMDPPTSVGGAWTESVIYNFGVETIDGAFPYYGNLTIGTGGVLFGTTSSGGVYGLGEVFTLTPPTAAGGKWKKATLHSFKGAADGASPYAGVAFGANGAIYGTTYAGGTASAACPKGCGAVYEVSR